MKAVTQFFMSLYVGLYRLTHGKVGGSMSGSKVLLLTATGRKSGKVRVLPLGCFDSPGGYVIVASNGGKPAHPGWYYNLKHQPEVTVQLFDKVMPATAEELTGEARAKAWQKVIATSPSYANYERSTAREIPLMLLHPRP